MNYELLVIINPTMTDEAKKSTIEEISNLITTNGGNVESFDTEKWGMRKLAYPINKMNEGYYVLYKLTAPTDCPRKVENALHLLNNGTGVLRAMFVRK